MMHIPRESWEKFQEVSRHSGLDHRSYQPILYAASFRTILSVYRSRNHHEMILIGFLAFAPTLPTEVADVYPDAFKALRHFSTCSAGILAKSPPAVCGSNNKGNLNESTIFSGEISKLFLNRALSS
mmetsp:Transcript_3775/g.5608  ORF Transcript_3775/g.5608 Transcript_3775/m.5608 type:complete len:126 (+) Transcript_3775:121-498(+)